MDTNTGHITDSKAIAAGIILYMLAPVGMSLLPLLTGTATETFGLTDKQTGWLAAADYGGITVAAVLTALIIRRISWRLIAAIAMVPLIVVNILSIYVDQYELLIILRFITELGTGVLFSLAIVVLGDTLKPDRYYAIGIGLTIALSTVFFLVIPKLADQHGLPVVFLAHAGTSLLLLPFIFWIPHQGRQIEKPNLEAGSIKPANVVPLFAAMIAFMLFTAAEGGIWAYIEPIGNASGLDDVAVGRILAITQVAGVAASIFMSWLSTRYGRTFPIISGLLLFIVGSYLLSVNTPYGYFAGAMVTQFLYIFLVPYFLLICVELDKTGRFFVLSTAFKLGGFSLGPILVAFCVSDGNLEVVSWVAIAVLIASLLIALPLVRRLDKTKARKLT